MSQAYDLGLSDGKLFINEIERQLFIDKKTKLEKELKRPLTFQEHQDLLLKVKRYYNQLPKQGSRFIKQRR